MARHVSDYSKNSLQLILDLINHDNGTNLTSEQVELINLVPTPESKEVQVTVNAKRGGGYRGSQDMHYNRVYLTEIPDANTGVGFEFDLTKQSDVLTFLNVGFGVNVGPEDVFVNDNDLTQVDPPVEQEFDVDQIFTLRAKTSSLVWMGQLQFTLTKVRTDLAEIWTVTNLDGLYAPFIWPEVMFTDTDGDLRQRPDGSFRMILA